MLYKTSLAFLFIFLSNNFLVNSASEEESLSACDLFSSKPVPYNTSSPVNVITKNAIKIHVNSTLNTKTVILSPLLVRNTGYVLEADSYAFEHSRIQISDGVLCDKTYIFKKTGFFVSDNPELSSFTQINGKGSPLTLALVYYNSAYGSFKESFKHRDGLAILSLQYGFTNVDNPLFYPFQSQFKKLLEPGAKVNLPSSLVYAAFCAGFVPEGYYSYYGSYIELETGIQYPSAIILQGTRTVNAISQSQFNNSFLKLKNIKGEKLISRQPIQQMGKRQIYKPDKGFGGEISIF